MKTLSHFVAKFTNPLVAVLSCCGRFISHRRVRIISRTCSLAALLAVIAAPLVVRGGEARRTQSRDPAGREQELKRKQEEQRRFQDQELITARPFTFIFNPGDPPRIVWRDADEVRRLGSDGRLRVRWFDGDLNETSKPTLPGRWGALIEATAPNGTPVRRAMTFFCRPPSFLFLFFPADYIVPLPSISGPILPAVWREHQSEFDHVSKDVLFKALNDTEAGTILLAGLAKSKPLGRAPLDIESAAVLNEEYHLQLKLKVLGFRDKVRQLSPPRKRATPAPALRDGTPAEAGMRPDAAAKIRAVCASWAKDSGEPFVTLVARNGVIVIYEAFGRDANNRPIGLDYRCDVASITKSATAILFSQFVDQGLIGLDNSVATVFADYPRNNAHVPTFRQCLTHMSGLSGHGDWGGVRNSHLENIILNGIDANEPGKAYNYAGMGFDLTAEAMEIVSGKSAVRLYHDHLFQPLGMGDVPMENASAGARFTARDLGTLAQWLANRGSYGDMEFVSPATFEALLPEPLGRRYQGVTEEEGIGMHWIRHLKPGAKEGSTRPQDRFFSPHTVGHGSLFGCIFLADLDRGLIVVQVRKTTGARYGEWSGRFFQAITDGEKNGDGAFVPPRNFKNETTSYDRPTREPSRPHDFATPQFILNCADTDSPTAAAACRTGSVRRWRLYLLDGRPAPRIAKLRIAPARPPRIANSDNQVRSPWIGLSVNGGVMNAPAMRPTKAPRRNGSREPLRDLFGPRERARRRRSSERGGS